jgi:hypothetical protein
MKAINSLSFFMALGLCPMLIFGQTIYTYPLTSGFSPVQAGGPDLIQIPNNDGLTGEFTTRIVPASTCGQGGTAGGYFFEDDAGLQFNSPEGFIDQSYSLALNFQFDEFIAPPGWVRLLSFTHIDDVGMYIKLTNPPTNGTLEFWPYGTAGQWDFFNTTDFYQMIIVRNSSSVITVYINGQEFATYDDSETQAFVPADPSNFIVFFRDDPSVLANEASPGFVSSIIIRNQNWTPAEVQEVWENFCSSLLTVQEPKEPAIQLYPNPVGDKLYYQIPDEMARQNVTIEIMDIYGKTISSFTKDMPEGEIYFGNIPCGTYVVRIMTARQLIVKKVVKK